MRARITLDHFEHIVDTGGFAPPYDLRVELLDGYLIQLPKKSVPHCNAVTYLSEFSFNSMGTKSIRIMVHAPIRIPLNDSEPEPDVVWALKRDYENHPEPEDVLLLIEVAEFGLDYDRGKKLSIYAEAGIQDYWIVNLIDSRIEVYRDPVGKAYQTAAVFGRNDAGPNPLAAPGVTLAPSYLF